MGDDPKFAPADVQRWDEATKWFLARMPMTKKRWLKLTAEARRKAFTVAGVAKADVLHDVHKAIDSAIAKGTTLDDFKKAIGAKLRDEWQGTVKNPGFRVETIYRTNVQQGYAAGRWAQMTDPVVAKHRPVGMFDAILDNRVTERCSELDGTILEWDEWREKGLVPPLHFNAVAASAQITTSKGLVPAGEVRVGQRVLTHRGRFAKVTMSLHKIARKTIRRLQLDSGRVLRVTHEHPILTVRDGALVWRKAGDIQVGDHVVEHGDQVAGSPDIAIPDPNDAPTMLDEPSISDEIVLFSGAAPVVLSVDLDGHFVCHEGDVKDVRSYVVLADGSRKQGDEVLFAWGEFAPESVGHASRCLFAHSGHLHPRPSPHVGGNIGSLKPPSPVQFSATLGDDFRETVGDANLLGLGPDGNAVTLAPSAKCGFPKAEFAFDSTDALPSYPVFSCDHVGNCSPIRQIDWHASAVIIIDDDASFIGHLCDFSVEEDETYVADGVLVHNCRSGIRSLRKSRAEKMPGWGKAAPDVSAQDGFGLAPDQSEWKPDTAKYPPDLGKEVKARLREAPEPEPMPVPKGVKLIDD